MRIFRKIKNLRKYYYGLSDVMDDILDGSSEPDLNREELKKKKKTELKNLEESPDFEAIVAKERESFKYLYFAAALIGSICLIGVLLYIVSMLPGYGTENPRTEEVVKRYIENGLAETGATNIISGIILDYRAFDTLGESHVLFTALICVNILLRIDIKNMRTDYEDYYTIKRDVYYDMSHDSILRLTAFLFAPCILTFGIYILLNGQNSPGGGFSGGAVLGAGLILMSAGFGFEKVDKFFTLKVNNTVTFIALTFYSFAKGYVFFTGANGIENGIPKGIPGAILSGGLILPLDIAVGIVVACTMFGFYSLFRRGAAASEIKNEG